MIFPALWTKTRSRSYSVGVSWNSPSPARTLRWVKSRVSSPRWKPAFVLISHDMAHGYTDTGQQLTDPEWFGHIVVCAGIQRGDLIRFLLAHGKNDNRCVGPLAQPAGDFQPVEIGQPQIEQDHVGALSATATSASLPLAASRTVKPCALSEVVSSRRIERSSSTTRTRNGSAVISCSLCSALVQPVR